MSIVKEFREFAIKGNVIDLAVGVIIGAAFNKIVDSLVKDVVMPIISLVGGDLDFSNKFVVLGSIPPGVPRTLADLTKAGVPVFAWGNFITVAVNFLIVVPFNSFAARMAAAPPPPAPPTPSELLLTEIRDLLKVRAA